MAYLRDRLAPDLNARRIAREAEQKYRQDVAAANSAHFKPLADLLAGNSRQEGDFCSSIAKDLREGTHINDVPARAAAITRDIWSKQMGGRRGSKAYEQAAAEFDSRFVAAKPEVAHAEMTSMAPLDRAKRFLVLEASLPELTKGTGLEAHEPQLLRSDMWQKDDGLGRALRELDSHRQALFGEMPFERAEGLLSTAREKLDDEAVEAASSGHVAKATVHLFANQHAAAAASLTRTVTLTVPCPEPNLALVESVRPKVQAHDVAEDLFYVSANPTDPQKDRFRHCRPVGVGDAIEMLLPGAKSPILAVCLSNGWAVVTEAPEIAKTLETLESAGGILGRHAITDSMPEFCAQRADELVRDSAVVHDPFTGVDAPTPLNVQPLRQDLGELSAADRLRERIFLEKGQPLLDRSPSLT
jgi:hypothetical protein